MLILWKKFLKFTIPGKKIVDEKGFYAIILIVHTMLCKKIPKQSSYLSGLKGGQV